MNTHNFIHLKENFFSFIFNYSFRHKNYNFEHMHANIRSCLDRNIIVTNVY